jgi:hypothetical protein
LASALPLHQLHAGQAHTQTQVAGALAQLQQHSFFAGINWDRLLLQQIKPPWQPNTAAPTPATEENTDTSTSTSTHMHRGSVGNESVGIDVCQFDEFFPGDVLPAEKYSGAGDIFDGF